MLRGLVIVLLAANLLFFGWTRDWFAPALPPPLQGMREPQRLQAQMRPETVAVLSPLAASAAVRAARAAACLQAGPLDAQQLEAADAALTQAGVAAAAVQRDTAAQPALWVVYSGPFTDPETMERREQLLRRLQIDFERLQDDRAPQPGLALGVHGERASAERALEALTERGLRSARVLELPARDWVLLRASVPEPALQAQLTGPGAAVRFSACAEAR